MLGLKLVKLYWKCLDLPLQLFNMVLVFAVDCLWWGDDQFELLASVMVCMDDVTLFTSALSWKGRHFALKLWRHVAVYCVNLFPGCWGSLNLCHVGLSFGCVYRPLLSRVCVASVAMRCGLFDLWRQFSSGCSVAASLLLCMDSLGAGWRDFLHLSSTFGFKKYLYSHQKFSANESSLIVLIVISDSVVI